MNLLIQALATGFFVGKIPVAPGTFGSAAAILPWLLLRQLPSGPYVLALLGIFVVGYLVSGSAEKLLDQQDPGCIVIDEYLGMFIALAWAPNHPLAWLLGFLLFRFFDILKPFPVSWFDSHFHGGLGIMLDDVMAGFYALGCLQLLWLLLGPRLL